MKLSNKLINFTLDGAENKQGQKLIVIKWRYGYIINKKSVSLNLSTGLFVHPDYWNSEEKRVRVKYDFDKINLELNEYETRLLNAIKYFEVNSILPSPDELKDFYQNGTPKQAIYNKTSLVNFVTTEIKDNVAETKSIRNHIKPLIKKIIRFEGEFLHKELIIEMFDTKQYDELIKWLYTTKFAHGNKLKYLAKKTVDGDIKKLIKFALKKAERKGIKLALKPHDDIKVPKHRPNEHVYLSPDKLEQLFKTDFKDKVFTKPAETTTGKKFDISVELNKVKDLIITFCFTGCRNQDWDRLGELKTEIIDKQKITFVEVKQQKGKDGMAKTVLIPATPPLISIYKKYRNQFPQKMDRDLFAGGFKEIGKILGWKEVQYFDATRNGKPDKTTKMFYECLGSHTCRRSFATNFFNLGVNPKDIMAAGGWSDLETFLLYVKNDNKESLKNSAKKLKGLFSYAN